MGICFACSTSSKARKFDFYETYPETDPSLLSFYSRREAGITTRNILRKDTPKQTRKTYSDKGTSRIGNVILRHTKSVHIAK